MGLKELMVQLKSCISGRFFNYNCIMPLILGAVLFQRRQTAPPVHSDLAWTQRRNISHRAGRTSSQHFLHLLDLKGKKKIEQLKRTIE